MNRERKIEDAGGSGGAASMMPTLTDAEVLAKMLEHTARVCNMVTAAMTPPLNNSPGERELQTKIAGLEKDLKQAKRQIDIREVATRRANRMLAERIRDVEEADEQRRRFFELVAVREPMSSEDIVKLWERAARPPTNILNLPSPV